MLRRLIVGIGAIAVLAIAPGSALAVGPHWWVKTPGSAKELTPGTTEHVTTSGNLAAVGSGAKDSCVISDEEIIENPTAGGPGVDEMVAFNGSCAKGPLAPCTSTEIAELKGHALAWSSNLKEPTAGEFVDEFPAVAVEVECHTSHLTLLYTGSLAPQLVTNKLKFTTASGTLTSISPHSLSFVGTDSLKGATYSKIRAK